MVSSDAAITPIVGADHCLIVGDQELGMRRGSKIIKAHPYALRPQLLRSLSIDLIKYIVPIGLL